MKEEAPGHDENEHGITQPMKIYEKGKTYKVCKNLATCFVQAKLAEEVKAPKESAKPKPEPGAGKAGKGPKENKGKK